MYCLWPGHMCVCPSEVLSVRRNRLLAVALLKMLRFTLEKDQNVLFQSIYCPATFWSRSKSNVKVKNAKISVTPPQIVRFGSIRSICSD